MDETSHDLLVRIDERVAGIQEEIRGINDDRRCHTHTEKIKTLERIVWGCLVGVAGMAIKTVVDLVRP
ncbi:hypothetical protein [Pseudodesulfovibrio sediminis]|uniref:Hemolysin XhlA n=1 Tax=Pseudodesulfovibrio sediminis TaxID=2810563 RepID=A0ABN6ER88_9BACT|nr:hypothetical protein [Pseudodesulfovibrio sediminis]BCS87343.1 hypothetical protein PSDVSF_05850 [Pseudodesulfovibrio sediminis]